MTLLKIAGIEQDTANVIYGNFGGYLYWRKHGKVVTIDMHGINLGTVTGEAGTPFTLPADLCAPATMAFISNSGKLFELRTNGKIYPTSTNVGDNIWMTITYVIA